MWMVMQFSAYPRIISIELITTIKIIVIIIREFIKIINPNLLKNICIRTPLQFMRHFYLAASSKKNLLRDVRVYVYQRTILQLTGV